MAKSYRRLNLFMAKPLEDGQTFSNLLTDAPVDTYSMADILGIDGILYVKQSAAKRPSWGSLLDEVTGHDVTDLENRSSSAVLLPAT
mgnify:FL=1